MPYIPQTARIHLNTQMAGFAEPTTAGELNYAITQLLLGYLCSHNPENYQIINDCLGALEGAKLEFYRRVVVPYEDKKIKENGDVYT